MEQNPNNTLNIVLMGKRSELFYQKLQDFGHQITVVGDVDAFDHPIMKQCHVDLCLVSGYYKIIPEKYLGIPKYGFVGFHETALPKGRGCAPINWTLINGEPKITVSMFKITKGMDEGDLIGQRNELLDDNDNFRIVREKANKMICQMVDMFLCDPINHFEVWFNGAKKQEGTPTFYPKRKPEDSQLSTYSTLESQWPLIRACDNENFPAYFVLRGHKYILKEIYE